MKFFWNRERTFQKLNLRKKFHAVVSPEICTVTYFEWHFYKIDQSQNHNLKPFPYANIMMIRAGTNKAQSSE